MNERKQKENERKFKNWIEREGGGRIYTQHINGRYGWHADYIKIVDADENTLEFTQKIFDENGNLVEIHQKYPEDKGHKKL